ncbi:MAG TPA: class I SAM-dependent methyltransferase [Polyangiaceae bacterium]|nr:class I SAM-dependent methyltransferase [Polyangiaceae bacterium]
MCSEDSLYKGQAGPKFFEMSALLPLGRVAYQAQQVALRLSLAAAHLGLRPLLPPREKPSRRDLAFLRRRFSRLLARDLENVRAGLYPEELLFSLPVREYLSGLPALAVEVARMARRARSGEVRDLPEEVNLADYPPYFRRNFHWQTDGYLSRRSAELYDLSVEFLFLGAADVMRRQTLPAVTRFLRKNPGQQRILDVACGTGRLLYQLSLAHPTHAYTGLDLSPFYIERARELLSAKPVSLVNGNAETLPFGENSYDAITSVFLFHELPVRARRNVLAEMRRVLRRDGLLVIEDAAQLADSPELRVFLENFGKDMNEPFFLDYLNETLEPMLEEAGFKVESVTPAFLSKVIVARAV